MPAGHLDLLLDQVEIVEQPFRCVGDRSGFVYGLSRAVVGSQDLFIFTQSREQSVGAPLHYHRVVFGEGFRVLDQLVDAEHLRAQGRARLRSCAPAHIQSLDGARLPSRSFFRTERSP